MDNKIILAVLVVALIGVVTGTYHDQVSDGVTAFSKALTENTPVESDVNPSGSEGAGDAQQSQGVADSQQAQGAGDSQNSLKLPYNYPAYSVDSIVNPAQQQSSKRGSGSSSGGSSQGSGGHSGGSGNITPGGNGTNTTPSGNGSGNSSGNGTNTTPGANGTNGTNITPSGNGTNGTNVTPSGHNTTKTISITEGLVKAQKWASSSPVLQGISPVYHSSDVSDGKTYYLYNFIKGGTIVGYVEIDAQTGAVAGGAILDEAPDPVSNSTSKVKNNTTNNNT